MSNAKVSGGSGRPCDLCLKPYPSFKDYCADSNAQDNVKSLLTYLGLDGGGERKDTRFALCPKCDLLTQSFAKHHHSLKMCQETLDATLQAIREAVMDSQKGLGDQSLRDELFEEGRTKAAPVPDEKQVSMDASLEGMVIKTEVVDVDQVSDGLVYDPISEDEEKDEDVDMKNCDQDERKDDNRVTSLEKDEPTPTPTPTAKSGNGKEKYVFPIGLEQLESGKEKVLHFCSRCNDPVDDPDTHRQLHDTVTPDETVTDQETGAPVTNGSDTRSFSQDIENVRRKKFKESIMREVPSHRDPVKTVKSTSSSKQPAYLQYIGKGMKFGVMQTLFKCTTCNVVVPNSDLKMHKRKHGEERIPTHLAKCHRQEGSGSAGVEVEGCPAPAVSDSSSRPEATPTPTPSPSPSHASSSCATPGPDPEKTNFNGMFSADFCDRRLDMMQFQQAAQTPDLPTPPPAEQVSSSSPAQGNDNGGSRCDFCSKFVSEPYRPIHLACRHTPELFMAYKKHSTSDAMFRSIVNLALGQMRREAADRARPVGKETLPAREMLRCEFCKYESRNSSHWKSHVVQSHGKKVGARLEQLQEKKVG